jgi:hypothetical protein
MPEEWPNVSSQRSPFRFDASGMGLQVGRFSIRTEIGAHVIELAMIGG